MARQIMLGQEIKIAVTALDPGFMSNVVLFKDGVASLINTVFTPVRTGLYQVSMTPTATGFYELAVENTIYPFEVVSKTNYFMLEDVYDFTLGSWQWDKIKGNLEVFRTNGTKLSSYKVLDNSDESSREKIG